VPRHAVWSEFANPGPAPDTRLLQAYTDKVGCGAGAAINAPYSMAYRAPPHAFLRSLTGGPMMSIVSATCGCFASAATLGAVGAVQTTTAVPFQRNPMGMTRG
jgi:hypothetical protein